MEAITEVLTHCPICKMPLFVGGSHQCPKPPKEEEKKEPGDPKLDIWKKLENTIEEHRVRGSNADEPYKFPDRPVAKKISGQTFGTWDKEYQP